MQKVAIIYDDRSRPETTGLYCRRALGQLVEVEHFLPTELSRIPKDFDLYLNVDDGLRYRLPPSLRPCAWWAIDTHLDLTWYLTKGPDFDFVFAAQKDGAAELSKAGLNASWLPLACDPEIHRKHNIDKVHDISFVGNVIPGPRADLLNQLQQRYPGTNVARCYFDEMAIAYSASRMVFNRSIKNDVNMRVFEALACGSLLLTDDLSANGLAELFQDGRHLATYSSAEELFHKIDWYLEHQDEREVIAAAGRQSVLNSHTYSDRMRTILDQVTSQRKLTANPSSPVTKKDRGYFEFARPEVLALVPTDARMVLELGCGTGRLGASIKERQNAYVIGVEIDEGAARAAGNRLDEVLTTDLDSPNIDFPDQSFDCVIAADVIEHLQHPECALGRVRRWLKPDGKLIMSLPNVQHHSVVRGLLNGDWTYETAGLLDSTHLHFFTKKTIEDLCEKTDFEIEEIQAVLGPGDSESLASAKESQLQLGALQINGLSASDIQAFFVYQYLVTASPKSIREPLYCTDESRNTPNVGVILAIRDRAPGYLRRAFETYQYQSVQPVDRVLLDYGSQEPHAVAYQALCEEFGWRYIRHRPEGDKWCLTDAYNRAAAALSPAAQVLFKSDVDVLLGNNVLALAAQLGVSRYCQFPYFTTRSDVKYRAAISTAEDFQFVRRQCPGQRPSAGQGLFACPRKWFEQIGGFDLNFTSWGYEDHDLRDRAERSIGAVDVDPRDAMLVHQWHPPAEDSGAAVENRTYFDSQRSSGSIIRNGGRLADKVRWPASIVTTSGHPSAQPVRHIQPNHGCRVGIVRNYSNPDFMRQTPGASGFWEGVEFTEKLDQDCDYAVILNELPDGKRPVDYRGTTWALIQEPPVGPFLKWHRPHDIYDRVYHQDESHLDCRTLIAPGALPWHVNRDYDTLSCHGPTPKTADVSCIMSNKAWLPGHRARISFLDHIRKQLSFDLFGHGFNPIADKWDALAPYRYSLAIENYQGSCYWTEKIADCFLAWTMPIYCGSPRIAEYFPPESMILIDINEPRSAIEIVQDALRSRRYERHLEAIAHARELVLNKYQLFPFLVEQIRLDLQLKTSNRLEARSLITV